jgi:hypothetical protein
MKNYTPSNGTDGMIFMSNWCDNCSKEKRCPILTDKLLNGYDSKKKEWVYQDNKPICTAFKKIGTPNKKIKTFSENEFKAIQGSLFD